MKASGEQIDDRIVEVHWDQDREGWRLMRFRDDKPEGNHRSVVDKIVQSILDGVEHDEVRFGPIYLYHNIINCMIRCSLLIVYLPSMLLALANI